MIKHETTTIAGMPVLKVTITGSEPVYYAIVKGDCGGLFVGEIVEVEESKC